MVVHLLFDKATQTFHAFMKLKVNLLRNRQSNATRRRAVEIIAFVVAPPID
jgi:hypothetical protein